MLSLRFPYTVIYKICGKKTGYCGSGEICLIEYDSSEFASYLQKYVHFKYLRFNSLVILVWPPNLIYIEKIIGSSLYHFYVLKIVRNMDYP